MFQYDSNGNQSEFNGRWNLSIRARLRGSKSFRSIARQSLIVFQGFCIVAALGLLCYLRQRDRYI